MRTRFCVPGLGGARTLWVLFTVLSAFLYVPGVAAATPDPLRVAVASNFRSVLERLAADFEAQSGERVDLISGSTGKLYAQILAGAPYDLFLAADRERAQRLEASGHVAPGKRATYAIGRLVLWDPRGGAVGPERLRQLDGARVALANPGLAPYGAAAQAVLRDLGLERSMGRRLVYGENVAQAFAFVRSGNAALGFVALAQLRALPPTLAGSYWEPELGAELAIRQDAVLLARSATRPIAQEFFAFLLSERTRALITAAGYGTLPLEIGEHMGDHH